MPKKKRQVIEDIIIILVSIIVGFFIYKNGWAHTFTGYFADFKIFAIFISGMFFTSIFTTAPSIALLTDLSGSVPLWQLSLFGGLGAMIGDLIIFKFVRDRFSEDLNFLLADQTKRFRKIFKTKLFEFFLPFIGALIIASPLPDELGVTILGFSKINKKFFLMLSFVFNGLGILFIGYLAQILIY